MPGQRPDLHPGQEAGWDRWPGGTVQVRPCGGRGRGKASDPAPQGSLLGAPLSSLWAPPPDPPSEPSRLLLLLPLPASPRDAPQGPSRSRCPIASAPGTLLPGQPLP